MFDRLFEQRARNRQCRRDRGHVLGLLDRLGARAARRRRHSHDWNDGDLHLPMEQLAPVVIRRDPSRRYRR